MILNYTNKENQYICNYLAEVADDEVIDCERIIKNKDKLEFFSQKPYLLIADYDMLCNLKTLLAMNKTSFNGSKIFYVIFVCKNAQNNNYLTHAFAKSISATKNAVLFGCVAIERKNKGEALSESEIVNAKILGSYVRDSIPFSGVNSVNYPIRNIV